MDSHSQPGSLMNTGEEYHNIYLDLPHILSTEPSTDMAVSKDFSGVVGGV